MNNNSLLLYYRIIIIIKEKMHTRINPKNRAKSTERKESSFMSEPLYLTKLIRNNIDRLYTINNISLTKMLSKGSEKELNHIKRRFRFCSESSSQYAINVEYSKIKSTVIHIMLYLLENKATSDIKSLCKLIKKLKATNEDLTVLAKLIVLIGYYNRLEIVDNNNELEITVNDRIKNYYCFDIAIDFVCFFDIDEVTDDFCSFLNNDILRNKPNLFYLVKNTKMLLLLYCKSKNVLGFLSRTYALHFSKEFIKFFISDLKDNFYYSDFVQKSKTMFAHMNRNIDFLDNLSTNEDKIYDKDSYVLSNGFVMNNNKNNGIKVNGVLLDEKFTMIFSFNFSPSSDNQKEFPIIFFNSSNSTKNAESMEFYIKGNRLMFLSFTGVNLDICQIEKNITYIIYFSIEVYRHLIITVKSLNNTFLYKAEYKARLKKNVSLHVGTDNKNNFEGYIGSIFLYKMIFDDEVKQNLFNLKGTYDKFLYFHSYLTNHIDKYEKNNNTLQDDFTINTNDYNKACNFFRKKDFTNNLICYICPVYEGSKLKKKTYKNNIFKNEFKVSYYIEPRVENGATFFFTNCNFIYEFLKYEGFNFLIFCYELIVSNLNKESTDEEADNALNFMNSLMKFTTDVFFQINIELYTKEAKMLLFSIRKAITKVNFIF